VYLEENIDSIHKNNKYWRTLLYGISFLKFSCYVQSVDELMSKQIHNKI
jgi:exopolysaccharide biosynthesis predicted pyruvyltransferase EpsI